MQIFVSQERHYNVLLLSKNNNKKVLLREKYSLSKLIMKTVFNVNLCTKYLFYSGIIQVAGRKSMFQKSSPEYKITFPQFGLP
jgi:hypothetical protein